MQKKLCKSKKKLAIFDFDGTLVNSITDVALCFNEALRMLGLPVHDIASYNNFIGGNLETVIGKMLIEHLRTEENIIRVKKLYRELYTTSDKPNTKPYDGILNMLREVKRQNVAIAINTNKGQDLTEALCEKFFSDIGFVCVVGYKESIPSKPDPYGVRLLQKLCGVSNDETFYIGDGKSDIDTAANACIDCVLATWGQSTEFDKLDARVTYIACTPEDILNYLKEA